MAARVASLTFKGVDVVDVDVQVHISPGVPNFMVVGLPDKTIAESRERVRSAFASIGLSLPAKRITVNLSPADLVKEGSHFDLPIALGMLVAMDILPADELCNYVILGELALDGALTSVDGILPAAIGAFAREKGIICPEINGREAAWSGNNSIIAAESLIAIINHFKGISLIQPPILEMQEIDPEKFDLDFADIRGQESAKRAIEIAAAGGHNLLMSGPPGSGKSMLAQRIIGLLPQMVADEILDTSMIQSIAGELKNGNLETRRPFRAPHHSCSVAAMVGGGHTRRIMPGEISLAHNGVLFLDELPEFNRQVLDSLRQPTETGEVLISRANSHVTFPARFQLIAAMNPCRCGYLSDPDRNCNRAPKCAVDYQSKISGPMLDRFDIHIDVPAISPKELSQPHNAESSKQIRDRVLKARSKQLERYAGYNIKVNAQLDGKLLLEYASPNNDGFDLLNRAVEKFRLSMRGYNRVLRLARTIADLEDIKNVQKHHISEAISYRQPVYLREFA